MGISDELTILVSVVLESIAGWCLLVMIIHGEDDFLVVISASLFFLGATFGISQLVYRQVLT